MSGALITLLTMASPRSNIILVSHKVFNEARTVKLRREAYINSLNYRLRINKKDQAFRI